MNLKLDNKIKQTAFYDSHIKLGAKILPFAGYKMPVSYSEGVKSEYFSVRSEVGMFDVSHMGEFFIHGKGATHFLQRLTINDINRLKIGDAQYSAMCYPDGGIIDDIILYKQKKGYLMVVNASNIQKDYNWLLENKSNDVELSNVSEQYSLIAIQGPKSRNILSKFSESNLNMPFYTFEHSSLLGSPVLLSRTGYTGELGFEIYGKPNLLVPIWDEFIDLGVKPAGLAARDILRMEMKYCLYGNDIDSSTNPIEAGLGWITKFSNDQFIGRESLKIIKSKGCSRHLIAFIMEMRGIPRKGYHIYINSKKVGIVTSGTQSPLLNAGIGLGYIDHPFNLIGQKIEIKIRNKFIGAKIVKPPFIKKTSLHD